MSAFGGKADMVDVSERVNPATAEEQAAAVNRGNLRIADTPSHGPSTINYETNPICSILAPRLSRVPQPRISMVHSRNLAQRCAQFGHDILFALVPPAAGDQSIKRHSGRKLQRVAPDRGFGGWGCPGPLALTGVGDQLTGAPSLTQSTRTVGVFDKNQISLHALSHWTPPARIRLDGSFQQLSVARRIP